jgi:excisionase family DNA binding protein
MHGQKAFVSVKCASLLTGLNSKTIRKMVDSKEITGYRTPSGQRRIDKSSLQRMCNNDILNEDERIDERKNFLYARVSTKRQMDDLLRQVEYIKSRRPEYASYTVIQDIGSGINWKRKGLSTILDRCIQRDVGEVVVAHRDRLSRFAFDLVESIVKKAGGRITVLDNIGKTTEEELSEDLMSIVHIFNCRQQGKRSYKLKVQDNDNKDLSEQCSK